MIRLPFAQPGRVRWRRPPGAGRFARGPWPALLSFSLLLVLSASIHATVIVPADLKELAVDASAITHGRVVRVEAQQGEGRRVERMVTLQVLEYFKGSGSNVVQVRIPGGSLGRYTTVMLGAPELAEGDEVVLFLGTRAANAGGASGGAGADADGQTPSAARPYILGLHQGVFRIVTDQATGRRMVMPPLVQGTEASSRGRGDLNRQPLELREFQGRIAQALAVPGVAAAAKASSGGTSTVATAAAPRASRAAAARGPR
jgi:hypothetical protein